MSPDSKSSNGSPVIAGQLAPADATLDEEGYSVQERTALLFMMEDLKRSRQQIELAHHEWITAMDVIHDLIFLHDRDYRILRCNRAYAERAGMSFKEIVGKHYWEVFPSLEGPLPCCSMQMEQALEKHGGANTEAVEEVRTADGKIFSSRSYVIRNKDGTYLYSLHVMEDITERKQADALLQESEARYKRITDGLTDYQYTVRIENGRAMETRQSPACLKVTGYLAKEFAANPDLWIQMVAPIDRSLVLDRVREVLAGNDVPPIEHRIIRKDGELRWVRDTIILFKDAAGKLLSYDGVICDISELKRHEELTADLLNIYTTSESLDWKTALQQGLDTIQHLTSSRIAFLHFVSENQEEIELVMWSSDTAKHFCKAVYDSHYPVSIAGIWADCIPRKQPIIVNDYAAAPGRKGLPEGHAPLLRFISAPILENEKVRMIIGVGNSAKNYGRPDTEIVNLYGYTLYRIVQRKRAQEAVLHANRALKTLSACNTTLIHAASEQQLLQDMCRVAVENGGYRAAWVGFAQHDAENSVRPMAQYGFAEGYLDTLQISWADCEYGNGPVGKAIRNGATQVVHDLACDPGYIPWREQSLQYGHASAMALPLYDEKTVFGCLTIVSAGVNAFNREEITLLEEMAGDLSYGIRTLRLRQAQERSAERMRKGLEETVEAVAAIVEMRDPYTAGHQQRVARLAAAIAVEMGLPEERVRGIHLAGTIHDLGKIQTPAEILSKPGKLSAAELNLIMEHPHNGYEILKDIKFPWPIAQMVLQHHEKLDGSGYPQHLKGNDILLEARILSVADVVEAMSSHRPYRPGLGIDAALEQIVNSCGMHYDPLVVEACVRLFREKGFKLE